LDLYSHLFSDINPEIQRDKQEGDDEDNRMGDLDVNDSLDVVDDEGPCIGEIRAMFGPQPNLEIGEGTVPIKSLNDESKGETG